MRPVARILAALLLPLVLGGCAEPTRPPGAAGTASSVLLITIDTLRADRLGAYGHARARTPVLDGVAREGIRFECALATAPITLTSHASLLSGRYPPGHGARHNGMSMRPVPTLATLLKANGFATAAFVAAFPLDRRFGLSHGFDVYSDAIPRGTDGRPLDERPAHAVADEAVAWLTAHQGSRFFAWVHFFEPHAPYGPPAAAAARPPLDRYDDEIAIADRESGRVISALGPAAASTLLVIAGDHGEAFGEHGEVSHSVFVYDATLRVPLLMKGAGLDASTLVPEAVSLVDVVPTVLAVLGLPPADTDGIDVRPRHGAATGGGRVLYAESFAPLVDFGWSPLRALRSGRWKYVAAPRPELFDVATDPEETVSVLGSNIDVARTLAARVDGFGPPELPGDKSSLPVLLEPDARRRLQALGYVGSAAARSAPSGRPDPKDRKALARSLALVFSGELQGQALESALRSILRDDPANGQARLRLGHVLLQAGRCPEAERHFQAAAGSGVGTADPWLGLATCAAARGDTAAAASALDRADSVEPGNPVVAANRGILYSRTGRHGDAVSLLAGVVADDPQFDEARFNLALAYARAGRRAEARNEAAELLRRLPPAAPQRREVERLLSALSEKD